MKEIALRENRRWSGDFRGVPFEIQNFQLGKPGDQYFKDCWTFYIYVAIDRLPDEFKKKFWLRGKKDERGRVHYAYSRSGVITSLEWHCGATWYSKESGIDGSPRVVKIGCDYQHLYDDEHSYNEKRLLMDVKACIDSLWTLVPGMKIGCDYNGGWYLPSEGSINQYGNFWSFDGQKQNDEYDAKRKAEKELVKP